MAGVVLIFIGLSMYLLPAILAFARSHNQAAAILLLNIFLGWTVVGWVGALVWAFVVPQPQTIVIHQHTPPST
jgi:hypothetical protein